MNMEIDVLAAVNEVVLGSISESWSARRTGLSSPASQGKRIRTSLAASCAALGSSMDATRLVNGCAAVEVLHLATLVHDDIIDESAERRGQESTWHAHGTDRSIVAGDALFGVAFHLAATAGADVASVLATAIEAVCAGQLRELDEVGRSDRSAEEVEQVAADKTGSLFGAAASIGILSTRGAGVTADHARRWGTRLGVAYQLLDDLQDIDGDAGADGSDLQAGLLTQPWIFADPPVDVRGALRATGRVEVDAPLLANLWTGPGPQRAWDRLSALLDAADADRSMVDASDGHPLSNQFRDSGRSIMDRNSPIVLLPPGPR